jgi:recombination protein RecT
MCFFKDGTAKHEYMSREEVDGIRKRSRAGNAGPWVTDYNEMAKNTVFRRMSKWVPLSPEIMDTVERDADSMQPATGIASAPVNEQNMFAQAHVAEEKQAQVVAENEATEGVKNDTML